MKLIAYPLLVNAVIFLQLIDNTLADIAIRSNIVRKDANSYAHTAHSFQPTLLNSPIAITDASFVERENGNRPPSASETKSP